MKIEIWSDIACPFCYIGKRRFEKALGQFEHRDATEVIWRSFQLDPDTQHVPGQSIHDYLAKRKGCSVDEARQMNARATEMARAEGLSYDFDRVVPANTFDAHRLTHLAASAGLQDAAEERLFAAYFSEGKNIADHAVLVQLGTEIGLDAAATGQMLASGDGAAEVGADLAEAEGIGIHGVPFFVLNGQYAVSGAQASAEFLRAMQQVWAVGEKDIQP